MKGQEVLIKKDHDDQSEKNLSLIAQEKLRRKKHVNIRRKSNKSL